MHFDEITQGLINKRNSVMDTCDQNDKLIRGLYIVIGKDETRYKVAESIPHFVYLSFLLAKNQPNIQSGEGVNWNVRGGLTSISEKQKKKGKEFSVHSPWVSFFYFSVIFTWNHS